MIPVLNNIGTVAACVGVSTLLLATPLTRHHLRVCFTNEADNATRTMILTLESLNSNTLPSNAPSHGFSPTSWILHWAMMYP